MARRAATVLLAAVEMGNKTLIPYREETFCLLLMNSWEILLKARIVQQNRNRLESILEKKSNGHFVRDPQTQSPHTIKFMEALNRVSVRENVRTNLLGINAIRNEVAHLGVLSTELRRNARRYGSASIVNFAKLYREWFLEPFEIPYLLPIAFVGKAEMVAPNRRDVRQRRLLSYLSELVGSTDVNDTSYAVTLLIDVHINPAPGGGGSIGVTNDPSVPQLSLSDDEILRRYPWTHRELTLTCKERYVDFKENRTFHDLMRNVKTNGDCAFERKLDPKNPKSSSQWRYRPETTITLLDTKYTLSPRDNDHRS